MRCVLSAHHAEAWGLGGELERYMRETTGMPKTTDFEQISVGDALTELGVDAAKSLTEEEVNRRQREHGWK
jgi:hypothetical protein